MPAFTNELIASALKQSLRKTKYQSVLTSDTRPTSADNNILNTEIEFEEHVGYSTNVSNVLKSKYIVLKPNKSEFCTKCQSDSIAMKQLSESVEKENVTFKLPSPQVVLFPPEDVEIGWKSTVPVGSGFINQGTTCYINSTLQALFHIPSFVNWLTNDRKHMLACEKKNGVFHNECMVCAMMNTLNASHKATGNSIRPRFIVDKIKLICKHLSACRQEDAHEFLRYLMEAVERSYLAILVINSKKLDNYSKETTPLNQIFGGYIRTEVTCLECKHMSTTFQHFQDIILDIRQSSSVVDALENYFSEERLDVDDAAYHCDQCKKKVAARKKYSIEKAPNVLCIQLKRFNAHSLFGGGKLSKMISIEQYVDLKKFKHKSASSQLSFDYRLVSMVFHHGPSANSGHYSALGCTSSGSYYYFNDEQVCPAVFSSYSNSQNAYIIFYEINNKSVSLSNKNGNVKKDASFHPNAVRNGYHNGTLQFQKDNTANTFPSRHSVLPFSKTYDRPYCSVLPQKEVKTYTVTPKKSNSSLFNGSNKSDEKSAPANSVAAVTSSTVNDNSSRYNAVIVATDVEKSKPTSQQLTPRKLVPYNASDSSSSSDENDDVNNNNGSVNNCKTSPEEIGSAESLQRENKKREGPLDNSSATESKQTQSSKFTHCVNIIAALNSAPLNQIPFNDDLVMMPLTGNNFNDTNNNVNDVTKGTDTKADQKTADGSSAAVEQKDVLPSTSKSNSTPLVNNKFFSGVNFPEVNGKSPRKCERSLNTAEAADRNAARGPDDSASDSDGDDSNGWNRLNVDDNNVSAEQPSSTNASDWCVKKSRLSEEKKAGEHMFVTSNNASDSFSSSTSSKPLNSITNKQNAGCSTDGQISTNSGAFGYGVKVFTWNGGLSYISQEAEKEHVESSRSGNMYSYNDEIDRGKTKKRAHSTINTDRVEHNGIKANPIQQYHNNLNNINKNGTNNCNNINSNSSSSSNSNNNNNNSNSNSNNSNNNSNNNSSNSNNNINENNINNNKRHYINWNNGKKSNYFARNHRNHFFNKHNKYPKYVNNHNHRYNRYIHRHRPYWRN